MTTEFVNHKKIQPLVLWIVPLALVEMVFVKRMNILISVPTVPTNIVVIPSVPCPNPCTLALKTVPSHSAATMSANCKRMNPFVLLTVPLPIVVMLSAQEMKTQPLAVLIVLQSIAEMASVTIRKINSLASMIVQQGLAETEFVRIQASLSEVALKIVLLKIVAMISVILLKIFESVQLIVHPAFVLKMKFVKLSKNQHVLIAPLATSTEDVNQMKSQLIVLTAMLPFIPSLLLSSTIPT